MTQKDCRNSRTKRANRIIKEEITTFQVNNPILKLKMIKKDPEWLKCAFLEKNWKYTENELDGAVENDEK